MLVQIAGCGQAAPNSSDGKSETAVTSDVATSNNSAASSESSSAGESASNTASASDPTPKEYVWDFDALVNDEWKEDAKTKAEELGQDYYGTSDEDIKRIDERLFDIFENTDISQLQEDSDLYKAIYVYRQLTDPDWQECDYFYL